MTDLSSKYPSDEELADFLGIDEEIVRRNTAVLDLVDNAAHSIRAMRTSKGMTEKAVADMIDVTAGRISQLESGLLRNAPSLKTLARIAHVLGYDLKVGFVQRDQTVGAGSESFKAFPTRQGRVSFGAAEAVDEKFAVDLPNIMPSGDGGPGYEVRTGLVPWGWGHDTEPATFVVRTGNSDVLLPVAAEPAKDNQ